MTNQELWIRKELSLFMELWSRDKNSLIEILKKGNAEKDKIICKLTNEFVDMNNQLECKDKIIKQIKEIIKNAN